MGQILHPPICQETLVPYSFRGTKFRPNRVFRPNQSSNRIDCFGHTISVTVERTAFFSVTIGENNRTQYCMNIEELINRIPRKVPPELVTDINAIVQLSLTGREAGEWAWTIRDGQCLPTRGVVPNPRLSLGVDSDLLLELIQGKADPIKPFAQGKIRVHGDLGLALKFLKIFKQVLED
jgi:putative sterol carrier protein